MIPNSKNIDAESIFKNKNPSVSSTSEFELMIKIM
jgi:hypothetical protein